MNEIMKIDTVQQYNDYFGIETSHPLVSVIDYAEVSPVRHSLNNYSRYGFARNYIMCIRYC